MKRDPYEIRHLIPIPAPLPDFGRRTREHRCGRCAWAGTGSTDCPNYRPSQSIPYIGPDDGPGSPEAA